MSYPTPPPSDPNSPPPASQPQAPAMGGSFRLFRLAGTDVFIHWSWFLAAFFLIQDRGASYSSLAWNVVEYVGGFGLVLLHEFGHVLACRSVGGKADRVVLWPLGGLAFVAPPPRPSAVLWTTAAGPLVNLVLAPAFIVLAVLTAPLGEEAAASDLHRLLVAMAVFNAVMLVFNLLPIFPLDGGRLLYAVLWWLLGRSVGLTIAAGLGMAAGIGLGLLAVIGQEWWMVVMAGFLVLGALGGLSHARLLARAETAPRRADLKCPNCDRSPPLGDYWRCTRCLGWFNLFAPTLCPKGGYHATPLSCLDCDRQVAPSDWAIVPVAGETETP